MINFALIGCGFIAKKHADAIERIEGARLLAVCDKIDDNMAPYAEKYDALTYTDADDMLQHDEIDVVVICTPSGVHKPLSIKAANAGKHLIVEKPIALQLTDTTEIINACQKNNVKLSVVHPNRFRPAIRMMREKLDHNRFGTISHANATVRWNRNQAYYDQAPWRGTKAMDGGVLMNQAIHNLDLLLWMMGPVEEIQAYATTRFRKIECEDVAAAVVRFQSGALGVIEAATTIYPKNYEESLSIFGERGSMVVGGPTANWIKHLDIEGLNNDEMEQMITRVKEDPFGTPGHEHILRDMVEAIRQDRSPIVTGEDGMNAVKLVLGIIQAAETRMPVRWEEII